MCRHLRKYCKSEIYHVILRGNNQQMIFYNDSDRIFFLNRMKKYSSELNIHVYAYCLMDNHTHILIGNANLHMSKFIQKLATSYAMYFNRRYEHTGHLFQGRYKSETIEDMEYFKTVTRYILQNPIKAKICDTVEYRWNSYKKTLYDNQNFIKKDILIDYFQSKEKFINFVTQYNDDTGMEYTNKLVIPDISCIALIKKILNIKASESTFPLCPYDNHKIRKLKQSGIPIKQIVRLTGFPQKIISDS